MQIFLPIASWRTESDVVAVATTATTCTRSFVRVRAHGTETIAGMRGREKTSDECIPRPARMRREHRAGGKGEVKDERKTEDRSWTGEGRSATRRYRFTKTRETSEDGEKREPERWQECRGRRWTLRV